MLTDKELKVLLNHIDKHFENKWQQIKNLELKVEELSNGKGEGPKTIVVAKEGDQVKTIRFGQQGVSGAGKAPKTDKDKARRKSFKARHAKNIAKGKMSAAYWANKEKW